MFKNILNKLLLLGTAFHLKGDIIIKAIAAHLAAKLSLVANIILKKICSALASKFCSEYFLAKEIDN